MNQKQDENKINSREEVLSVTLESAQAMAAHQTMKSTMKRCSSSDIVETSMPCFSLAKELDKDIHVSMKSGNATQHEVGVMFSDETSENSEEVIGLASNKGNNRFGILKAWIMLIISSVILIFLTLSFFTFYSSVACVVFFKHVGGVFVPPPMNTILSEVAAESMTTLLVVLLIPIIFLVFCIVQNGWWEETGWHKYIKIFLITVVSLILDTLLFYAMLAKDYYDFSCLIREELQPYSFSIASHDSCFWGVICMGFVERVMWIFTFGYVLSVFRYIFLLKKV